MPLFEKWPSRNAAQLSPYYAALVEPGGDLRDAAPPSLANLAETASLRRAYIEQYIDRGRLTESLRASHLRRGAPGAVLQAVEQLRGADVLLVVTGQQPGLLGGPLFTLYKAAQAIALAKQLSAERNEIFLPAFWNASEDHDFDEIASVKWLNKDRQVESYTWELETGHRPLYHIAMDELPLDDLITRIDETTHPSDFKDEFFAMLRECRQSAQTYPDFFDAMLWRMFGEDGLIILRPDDRFAREDAVRLMADEINQPGQSSVDISQRGERLQAAGLPQQLHKSEDRAAFFLIRNHKREALRITPSGFQTDSGETIAIDAMQQLLQDDPGAFSPSAILRPVLQDAVYPIAAAVLGPGEMGYHFLLDAIYARHGVPRPVLVPRMGITWLEPRDRKTVEKWNLTPNDLKKDAAALLKQLVSEGEGAAPPRGDLDRALSAWFESMKERAASVDPTIAGVLDKNAAKIQKELDNSENLLLRRMANKETQTREQIEALQASLMPGGALQERNLSFISYYLKHGTALIEQIKFLAETTSPGAHVYAEL
ncbi:MAG: bacillithiol biosynthesis cysteine-adding enzyme BshC [Candidatus Hinthialibacter antarcticus]|nr:bacillithiol biosynthesis cysteine-adding enzyme BshC [Candidatus Hinthialibacter antarcticus]